MDKSIQCIYFGRCFNMKLILFASYICLSLAYINTPTQYHIQTDDGSNRYFRYQTYNGQYRKEKRFEDGTVVGTYGWVDANNYLRLYSYIADENGYRIVNFQKRKVDPIDNSIRASRPGNPILQSSEERTNQFGTKSDESIEDVSRTPQLGGKQPEFINSKIHPKLQPNYSNNHIQRRVYGSEEDDSDEEPMESRRRQPEFLNSKMHPKLRPLYARRQRRRQVKRRSRYSAKGTRVLRRRQTSPEFINSKTHSKLIATSGELIKTQEFINSKMHPKLRPDNSGNNGQTDISKDSFGTKKGPTTDLTSTTKGKSTQVPEEFRMDEPGGKITIDFDLGVQYRREKSYPGGRIVGEHGYVDPLGILRRTFYKSGPGGLKQKKVSYWVGTRSPGS